MLTSSSPRSGRGRPSFSLDRARLDERALDARRRSARRRRRRRADRPDRRPADVDARACSCRTACASSAPTRSRPRSTRCAARAWDAPPGSRSSSPSPSSTPRKAPRRRCNQLRELISVMRLFKAGGIGLGPYAFAPTGEDCWRRIATGAPATRPGGYRLSEARGRASWSSWPAPWRPAPTPTAPSPGRSAASRWAASARARSTGSATTCWRCARCSRATARSAPRCRCAPRR